MQIHHALNKGVLATLAGLIDNGMAYGVWPFRSRDERIDSFSEKLDKELNLVDRQRRVLQDILSAFQAKVAHLHDNCEQLNCDDVFRLATEHHQNSDIMAAFAADQFMRFNKALTAEQRAKLLQLIEKDPLGARHWRFSN